MAGALSLAEFAEVVPQGRLAGLDVGTKTIGLATCDAGWSFATAVETLKRTKFTADLEKLKAFIAKHAIAGLVVGLPLNMDGTDSPRTQSVRAFARNLAPLVLPILLWDERWSTVAVERAMIEADMSRARRAEKVDAHAAAHILQGAIDALANLPHSG
jgi:putative Holliday junction resolvase